MKNNITYTEKDGILYPDIALSEQPQSCAWEVRNAAATLPQKSPQRMYIFLKSSGKLTEHLQETQTQARNMVEQIVAAIAKSDGTDKTLKAENPMRWTGLMNNYRHSTEEIVLQDLIFQFPIDNHAVI